MEQQNMEYLGETWNTTEGKLATLEQWQDTWADNIHSEELQDWIMEQENNQTEIYKAIQEARMDIKTLDNILKAEGITATKKEIGWTWHLLHWKP